MFTMLLPTDPTVQNVRISELFIANLCKTSVSEPFIANVVQNVRISEVFIANEVQSVGINKLFISNMQNVKISELFIANVQNVSQ